MLFAARSQPGCDPWYRRYTTAAKISGEGISSGCHAHWEKVRGKGEHPEGGGAGEGRWRQGERGEGTEGDGKFGGKWEFTWKGGGELFGNETVFP